MSFCEDENLGNFEWEKNKFISKSVIRDEHVRQFFKAVWVIFVFEKFQLISIFIGYFNIKYFVFKLIKKIQYRSKFYVYRCSKYNFKRRGNSKESYKLLKQKFLLLFAKYLARYHSHFLPLIFSSIVSEFTFQIPS